MQNFLIAANILNRYRIESVDSKTPPTMEKVLAFLIRSQSFKVRMNVRH